MAKFTPALAPQPKRFNVREGAFDPTGKAYTRLEAKDPQELVAAARTIGLPWEITASTSSPKAETGLIIALDKSAAIKPQGYKLTISPQQLTITASTPAGAFYGACTLKQIIRCVSAGTQGLPAGEPARNIARLTIPCLSINDWPDMPVRGVMLDISRDKVPTMETLYYLVDLLADWKINQLQLYTEHTFAYLAHPEVWKKASPMTGQQILELDACCKERFVELVPNQNSFGHMSRWLVHDKYRQMAEAPDGCDTSWGHFANPFTLCPIDKHSIEFLKGLFDELLPHFTSRMFNAGLDETIDLGCGRSAEICKKHGTGRVYYDFLMQIYREVKQRNHTMQFWGDIILKHPELIPELPQDLIALEWGYEATHNFKGNTAKFSESGIPFYVCPGTSSWNSLAGRTDNAIGNISSAALNCVKNGAVGLLNTDWGDNGHWQPLSVSYLGYIAGAMASWNAKSNLAQTLPDCLSIHAFGDSTGKSGKAFYDLGNAHLAFEKRPGNSSLPWHILFRKMDEKSSAELFNNAEIDAFGDRIADASTLFQGNRIASPDAAVVRQEFAQAVNLLKFAATAGRIRLKGKGSLAGQAKKVLSDHKKTWLLRNRPGGLPDSAAALKAR